MSSKAVQTLGLFQKATKFDKGIGACLPEGYKKFYKEWKHTEPAAVHYIPEEGRYRRDEVTGEVFPIQNIPLPLKYPLEYNDQMWGGEAVVQGFQKRDHYARRVPRFWVPALKRTVVYSEVLDKYISVIVTNRLLNLIHSNYGFDHYILKTPACDLKSLLPLGIKRKILQELSKGCPTYTDNQTKQQEIMEQYSQYLSAYTDEEIEWYGYSFNQACKKLKDSMDAANQPTPLKHVYRAQLIEKLKAAKLEGNKSDVEMSQSSSWIQRINPFGKKHET
ncbi:large ribosomal subunit protein bL28m [Onthophagus taurus]|uniref:large ribosomal subunit protein bL28m n=1 Tax=Onthophagus taurus TaxID=166361 RepID=UPI0039BDD915